MDRLLALWKGSEKSASNLEHASQVVFTLWMTVLKGANFSNPDDLQNRLFIGAAADLDTVRRVIDDEVTWHLGNRREAAVLVDDDGSEIATVGEFIERIAMLVAIQDKWPPDLGECPVAPSMVRFGAHYNALITGVMAGSCPQPRRRTDGAPPVPRPRRIHLAAIPHRDGPAR
ncbi:MULTISPECIES: hypothetical protein [Nocardia]|uniref:hypothetical protein n=1 Tax=Nocardia TaxID=1817 RepID=UPI00245872B5|nr:MULTISPECIES: hypothetical protein [Nocardia]